MGQQKQALLDALQSVGAATTREVMALTGLELHVASSRLQSLRREGLVIDTGERRVGTGTQTDKVYALSPAGGHPVTIRYIRQACGWCGWWTPPRPCSNPRRRR